MLRTTCATLAVVFCMLTPACSASERDVEPADEGALREATSEWEALSQVFESAVASDATSGTKPASVGELQLLTNTKKTKTASGASFCNVMSRFAKWVDGDAPRPFVFVGASADLSLVGGGSLNVEGAWDLYHNQFALFRGHSLALANGVGIGASVYGGLGIQNTTHARSLDALGEDVIESWAGANYSIGVTRDVGPLLSVGVEVFGDPQFLMVGVTLRVSAGFDLLPEKLPAALEKALAVEVSVSRSSMTPSDTLTLHAAEFLKAGRVTGVPLHVEKGSYEDKDYAYLQFDPASAPVGGEHGRRGLATSLSMLKLNRELALLAGPIAVAIGVMRDVHARHGVSPASLCVGNAGGHG